MKDNLEKFISENRDAFDLYDPNPDLWKKIEKNMNRKTIAFKKILWRAAAVAMIFGASLIFHRYIDMLNTAKTAKVEIPELQEAEIYYSSLLNSKLSEIKPMLEEHPGLDKEIMSDLSELDSVYSDLKEDLKDNVANQEVIQAMIQNYRLRLSILEDILNELNKDNNDESKDFKI
jgi:hypothetical protein